MSGTAATGDPRGLARDKVLCSVCADRIHGSDWVACLACEVPVHRKCWEYAGKCPVYACGSDRWLEPIDLFLKPRPPVNIDSEAAPPAPRPQESMPATPEARAALYLTLDRRREELESRYHDLVSHRLEATSGFPGAGIFPVLLLLMIVAPEAWLLWAVLMSAAAGVGVARRMRASVRGPTDEEILRLGEQIKALERFQIEVAPPRGPSERP
ncbi:MAG: hypothetical protein HY815_01310 [Candidatus Riflebacteria bacterium]|nr:hypothetical protein [Candidatus Riflebacteria bacterium]